MFPQVGCARRNRHRSQVISLDAGSRMHGIPALDLWDVVIEVLHSSENTNQTVGDHCIKQMVDDQVTRSRARSEIQSNNPDTKSKRNGNREVHESSKVDHVLTSAKHSQFDAQLYICEDNEAVIKMLKKKKGRSPTMRHVSRTHRVVLDWLFDRIILDPKNPNQIHVDTKNQLQDMLTKGSFTRDE